jgi:CheY-like chemotaxis protein
VVNTKKGGGTVKDLLDRSILVVNDKEFFRTFFSDLLEDFGYRVERIAHGESALNLLENTGFRFELYIIDLQIPFFLGLDLIKIIRHKQPAVPIIAVTSLFKRPDDTAALSNYGVDTFLYSCIPPEDFLSIVNERLFPRDENRRAVKRELIHFPVMFSANGKMHSGYSYNLGENGMFIKTEHSYSPGSTVNVEFCLPDSPVKIAGKAVVKYQKHKYENEIIFGFGISFELFSSIEHEKLANYFSGLPYH